MAEHKNPGPDIFRFGVFACDRYILFKGTGPLPGVALKSRFYRRLRTISARRRRLRAISSIERYP